jgi:nicotinate-nucleotide adenylyltransferase
VSEASERGPKRIGVYGGTFDPVHIGHMAVAVNVHHALRLDRLLMVVANVPWQKTGGREVSPAEDRFAMVEAATRGLTGVEGSRLEIDRGGPSYSADTLAALAGLYPGAELFCVVGEDVASIIDTWERVDAVRTLATLVVVNRPGSTSVKLDGWREVQVEVPALDVSSTDLRARVADGRPLEFLVPDPVIHCIRERGLYADRP